MLVKPKPPNPDHLIEALLFRCDRDLAACSDSITSELCGVDHGH
jgi:hypothetical protein